MEFGVGMEAHVSVFLEPTVLQEILMVRYIQLLLYTLQNVSICYTESYGWICRDKLSCTSKVTCKFERGGANKPIKKNCLDLYQKSNLLERFQTDRLTERNVWGN